MAVAVEGVVHNLAGVVAVVVVIHNLAGVEVTAVAVEVARS